MGIYAIKPAFQRLLAPVVRRLVTAGVSADALTWLGLVASAGTGFAIWLGRDGGPWLLAVPAGALLRTAANALDGLVAGATATGHPFGEFFNEVTDRIGDATILLPTVNIPGVPDPLVAVCLGTVMVASFAGNAVRAAGGPRVYAGVMGKADRMLVMGAAGIAAFLLDEPGTVFEVALWVILAGAVLTLMRRLAIARRSLP